MNPLFTAIGGVVVGLLLGGMAYAVPEGIGMEETEFGPVFTNTDGMTLYIFAQDEAGASSCVDACLKKWPVAEAAADAEEDEEFTILERPDGLRQWMYHEQPLYTWVMDLAPGQATGHQVGGVWFAAQPDDTVGMEIQ